MVEPHYSNFRIITAIFHVFKYSGISRYFLQVIFLEKPRTTMFPYLEEDSAGSYGMLGLIQFVMYKVII